MKGSAMQRCSKWLLGPIAMVALGLSSPAFAESGDGESVYVATARNAGLAQALDAAAGTAASGVLSTVAYGTPGREFGAAVSRAARAGHEEDTGDAASETTHGGASAEHGSSAGLSADASGAGHGSGGSGGGEGGGGSDHGGGGGDGGGGGNGGPGGGHGGGGRN